MHKTLFIIPHSVFGVPVFGLGWLFGFLLVSGVVYGLWAMQDPRRRAELKDQFWGWLIGMFVVWFVAPRIEILDMVGNPMGIAVRGYGACLLMAVVSAVALCVYRGRKMGLGDDVVFALAPWLVIGGVAGGRLFYVVLNYKDYVGTSVWDTLGRILAFQSGGLVVYGAMMGGLFAGGIYCYRYRQSFLKLGDMVVPGLFLGVAIGRIGCLMNGCCWGGRCEEQWFALHFPRGSPVYEDQLSKGELMGLKLAADDRHGNVGTIESVSENSLAGRAGFKAGQRVEIRMHDDQLTPGIARDDHSRLMVSVESKLPTTRAVFRADDLPPVALPVRPAQVISSLTGLTICTFLLLIAGRVKRSGMLLSIAFSAYAVIRFMEEIVREDEPGRFGTSLTIAQWVSIVSISFFVGLMLWIRRQPLKAA